MSFKNNEAIPAVNPWTDAISAILIIDDSVTRLEHEYLKSFGNFDSLSEYSSSALCVRGLSSLTYTGEETFFALSKSSEYSEVFSAENAKFALQGYNIALRACLKVARNRKRHHESPMQYFPALMQTRLEELQSHEGSDFSVNELLYSGISDFVYKFMSEPPENEEIIQKDFEGASFSNRWAYKLGYLQPVSVAFGLMIDPETYFELVDKPERWEDELDPELLNDFLDILTLPVVEDV